MASIGEVYKSLRDESQKRRADNREKSRILLEQEGIEFTSHNNGAHLVVNFGVSKIDFWPGTGKWAIRSGNKGRGVFNLIKLVQRMGK